MSHQQDIKTALLARLGFLGTAIVTVLIFLMVVVYYQTESRLDRERRINQPYAELDAALEDQRIRLVEYVKGDTIQENGQPRTLYQIPITEAMRIVVHEWETGVQPGPPPKPTTPETSDSAAQPEDLEASSPDTTETKPADDSEPQSKPFATGKVEEPNDEES